MVWLWILILLWPPQSVGWISSTHSVTREMWSRFGLRQSHCSEAAWKWRHNLRLNFARYLMNCQPTCKRYFKGEYPHPPSKRLAHRLAPIHFYSAHRAFFGNLHQKDPSLSLDLYRKNGKFSSISIFTLKLKLKFTSSNQWSSRRGRTLRHLEGKFS